MDEAESIADQVTMEGATLAGGSKGDRAMPKKARKKRFQRITRQSRTPVYRTAAHVLAEKQQQVRQAQQHSPAAESSGAHDMNYGYMPVSSASPHRMPAASAS